MTETQRLVAELLTIAVAVNARRRASRMTWITDARRMAAIIADLATSWEISVDPETARIARYRRPPEGTTQ